MYTEGFTIKSPTCTYMCVVLYHTCTCSIHHINNTQQSHSTRTQGQPSHVKIPTTTGTCTHLSPNQISFPVYKYWLKHIFSLNPIYVNLYCFSSDMCIPRTLAALDLCIETVYTFLSGLSQLVLPLLSVYWRPKYHTSLSPIVRETCSNSCLPRDFACHEEREREREGERGREREREREGGI